MRTLRRRYGRAAPASLKIGDTFDYFGEQWTITRLRRRGADRAVYEADMRRDDRDAFGKTIPTYRSFHVSAIAIMRKIGHHGHARARS